MKKSTLKFKIQKYSLVILFFGFCFLNLAPQDTLASSSSKFRIEIFYAKEVKEIDTTQSSTATLTNPNNSSLDINFPADVLTSGDRIELATYSTPKEAVTFDNPLPSGKFGSDIFYNISFKKVSDNSPVSSLDKPVTLTFFYTDSDISGINESTLKAYHWSGSQWVVLGNSSVDATLNNVTATTQQFSNFSLLGDSSSIGSDGGGGTYIDPQTAVIFSGKASYPLSKIGLLKDGLYSIMTTADPDANFNVSLTGLSPGNHTFVIFAEDKEGRRSSLFTLPVFITQGATTQVSDIFIAPAVAVDKTKANASLVVLKIAAIVFICFIFCKFLWKKSRKLKDLAEKKG